MEDTIDKFLYGFILRKYTGNLIMTKKPNENEVWIFISIDLFYVVFELDKSSSETKLLFCVPVEQVTVKNEYGKGTVSFYFKERVLFWSSEKKFVFFVKDIDVEEIKTIHNRVVSLTSSQNDKNDYFSTNQKLSMTQDLSQINELKVSENSEIEYKDSGQKLSTLTLGLGSNLDFGKMKFPEIHDQRKNDKSDEKNVE